MPTQICYVWQKISRHRPHKIYVTGILCEFSMFPVSIFSFFISNTQKKISMVTFGFPKAVSD